MAHLERPPIALGFSFDGVDDDIEIPHHVSLMPSEITVLMWIYVRTWEGGDSPLNKSWYGDGGYRLWLAPNNAFQFGVVHTSTDIWYWAFSNTGKKLNQWYHVAGSYKEGDYCKIYVNGVLEGQTPSPNPMLKTTSVLDIGSELSLYRFFDGLISGVHIYNRTLSQAEISDLYSIRRDIMDGCVLKLGTVGLVRGGGTQWLDESPYKNHGTVYGAKRVRCCHCNPVMDYGT